jgi:outer membrane receptor for ferrienterochelin and colicin
MSYSEVHYTSYKIQMMKDTACSTHYSAQQYTEHCTAQYTTVYSTAQHSIKQSCAAVSIIVQYRVIQCGET